MKETKKSLTFALALLIASAAQAAAQTPAKPAEPAPAKKPTEIPSGFGPFKAKSTAVSVYRAKLNVNSEDLLGDKLFIVVRTQADKTHRFGWIRAFINNQLVATEQTMKENRIVEDVSRWLKPGETQLSIMGAAYPETAVDFYIVPKDGVLGVLQSKPLGTTVNTAGPFSAAGEKQEKFSDAFSLTPEEARSRLSFTIKTSRDHDKRFSWIRAYLNGQLVASERDFSAGEATVDVTGKAINGQNKVEVIGVAAAGTPLGWYFATLPVLSRTTPTLSASAATNAKAPRVLKVEPSSDISAGQTVNIQGLNFESTATKNVVYFDGKLVAPIKSGTSTSLTVEVPKELQGGISQVNVVTSSGQSNAVSIVVKGLPVVRGTSASACPPGYELEIKGDNFPERPNLVRVLFGSMPARVLQSTRQSVLVAVPELPPDTTAPIKVQVGQLQSNTDVSVRITSGATTASESAPKLENTAE